MRRVLATEPGGGIYRKRQVMIEPIFGDIKFNREIDQFPPTRNIRRAL